MITGVLRSRSWDAVFVALAVAYGAALWLAPSPLLIALGLWWLANTVAHNFIHRPFFASRELNALFSLLLTTLMGVPQTLWRQRHLAHHAGREWRLEVEPLFVVEAGVAGALWALSLATQPALVATVLLPGYAGGLLLCALQGHYEHAAGTTSHYGRVYNLLFFNDGYHAEHHAHPGVHWTELPRRRAAGASTSRWPPVLRWLEGSGLQALERLALRSPVLQRFLLRTHRRALEPLVRELPACRRVAIIGGALFPRTVLVLRELIPSARLTVIDANAGNLAIARTLAGEGVEFIHQRYGGADDIHDVDLVVIPLSFEGDRTRLYRQPPAPALIVHDWLWRPRAQTRIVSLLLLKRVNLVRA